MRAQWHRAPGSSVRSSPAARPRRFSRPFRESRGTLADRGSLLVPLRFFADRAAKCRALRRKSSQREFPPSPRFDPDVCRRACVISPVDLMIRRDTERPGSPRLEGEKKKRTHRQPCENNASKAYRGGDALQTAEIHAPRQVSKDHLIILRIEPKNRSTDPIGCDLSSPRER